MSISIQNPHMHLVAFLLLASLANDAAAQASISFPYCESSPLPSIDLTIKDDSKETPLNCLIDCRDISSIFLLKGFPHYTGVITPKVGRGILGFNPMHNPLATSIPFYSLRQLSYMPFPVEKMRRNYDLILGIDNLQTCQVTLNPDTKQLTLQESSSTSNALASQVSNFAATDVLIDSNSFNFRFDLTYPSALVLSKSTYHFVSKNCPQSIQTVHEHWNGTDTVCRLRSVTCAGVTFPSVWCLVQGNEDLIGMGLLTSFIIKLDFNSGEQQFVPSERIAQFADHSFSDGFDFGTQVLEGKQMLMVKDVLKDSIAFDSGFQKSDLLVKVDNFDLIDLNKQSTASALHLISTPRDRPLHCTILRAGNQMQIDLLSHNLTEAK